MILELDDRSKCKRYGYIIERNKDKYIVRINNTDRAETSEEKSFINAIDAARCLIAISCGMSGSIKENWKNKGQFPN